MPDASNVRWRVHVDSLTARILEECGYKTNVDFEAVKIRELLSHGSLRDFDIEALLCGLYTESHRDRKKPPKYVFSRDALNQRRKKVFARNEFLSKPERLAALTIGEFLALDGIDEVSIPGVLKELIRAVKIVRETEKRQAHDKAGA